MATRVRRCAAGVEGGYGQGLSPGLPQRRHQDTVRSPAQQAARGRSTVRSEAMRRASGGRPSGRPSACRPRAGRDRWRAWRGGHGMCGVSRTRHRGRGLGSPVGGRGVRGAIGRSRGTCPPCCPPPHLAPREGFGGSPSSQPSVVASGVRRVRGPRRVRGVGRAAGRGRRDRRRAAAPTAGLTPRQLGRVRTCGGRPSRLEGPFPAWRGGNGRRGERGTWGCMRSRVIPAARRRAAGLNAHG